MISASWYLKMIRADYGDGKPLQDKLHLEVANGCLNQLIPTLKWKLRKKVMRNEVHT